MKIENDEDWQLRVLQAFACVAKISLVFLVLFLNSCSGDPDDCCVDKCEYLSNAGDDIESAVDQETLLSCNLVVARETELCLSEMQYVYFEWEQVDGPVVELTDTSHQDVIFVPTAPGTYSFRCRSIYPETEYNRTQVESTWDTVWVTVP